MNDKTKKTDSVSEEAAELMREYNGQTDSGNGKHSYSENWHAEDASDCGC